jgi:RNA polymerase sigma-70 factor (ECF subfamily)
LVQQAKNGDAEAFTELVRVSAPRLHGVARLILRDPDRAKDAVQDAFIAAWQDITCAEGAEA